MNTGTNQGIKDGKIEAYHHTRYFTVTGEGKGRIGEGQSAVNWLVDEYLKPQPTKQTPPLPRSAPTTTINNLTADEVIAKIRNSKQAPKFDALMNGNITGHESQSDADLALCGVIAFWTQDTTVIDTIFRTSGLMRQKWEEKHRTDKATYGQMTIEKALSGNKQTYQPKRHKKKRRVHKWLS